MYAIAPYRYDVSTYSGSTGQIEICVRGDVVIFDIVFSIVLFYFIIYYFYILSSGRWAKITVKLPHFHVSDTCRALI